MNYINISEFRNLINNLKTEYQPDNLTKCKTDYDTNSSTNNCTDDGISASDGTDGESLNELTTDSSSCNILTRNAAARLLFEAMHDIPNEPYADNITSAVRLKDLYDCAKCVRYIAEVYVKGIIEPYSYNPCIFGKDKYVTEEEALIWVDRLYNEKKRKPPKAPDKIYKRCVSLTEAKTIIRKSEDEAILADLREQDDADPDICARHVKVSFRDLFLNPLMLTQDRNSTILFLCEYGAKSAVMVQLFGEMGFTNVVSLRDR